MSESMRRRRKRVSESMRGEGGEKEREGKEGWGGGGGYGGIFGKHTLYVLISSNRTSSPAEAHSRVLYFSSLRLRPAISS